jgi:HD-GYP domain-containing protein (c-di-GMP phosphodiesterase class II)
MPTLRGGEMPDIGRSPHFSGCTKLARTMENPARRPTLSLRLGELVCILALGQDNAFGQPLESQLRSCLLSSWLSERAGHATELRSTIYWVSLLRYVGCTGHAHEVAAAFGDEIALRARTLVHDAGNIAEVMHDVAEFATAGHPADEHAAILQQLEQTAHAWAVHNFRSGCEVGDMLAARLGVDDAVRHALRFTFERWNGAGFPSHAKGEDIPLAMRVVHLTHDMEAIARLSSPEAALAACRDRRDRTYDPALADLFSAHGAEWLERLATIEPWDAVLELEPTPRRTLDGGALDEGLAVLADFVDLKSPYMAGHSRRAAKLCEDAARQLGLVDEATVALRRAALVHDLGITAISNAIWDKRGALTRAERDRVQLHPMLTEQMLQRSPALSALIPIAASHHETADGTGYHKRLRIDSVGVEAGVLAASDIYVGLTAERADRAARSAEDAAAELRGLASRGVLEQRVTQAVLSAAGHAESPAPASLRPERPGGLSRREVEVLRLAVRGMTTKEIAKRLFISAKTADHHIQHIYTKIGVSTRAAVTLWAIQHDVAG